METDELCRRSAVIEIRTIRRLLGIYYLITLHLAVAFFLGDKISQMYTLEPRSEAIPAATPLPVPQPSATPADEQGLATPAPAPPITERSSPSELLIPVQGIKPEQLTDSFRDARSEGRVHDAIDIMAPAGTPVLAAADGEIVKFFESKAGGTTIYQASADHKFIYYYAHLQRRADDLREGVFVKQGRVIAYVGDTGNAGPGNYHLHFAISITSDPRRFWQGTAIDPYPLLRK